MENEETKNSNIKVDFGNFDPLGIKGATDISKDVVKFGLDGAKTFLNLTCKPLLEEFGLGLKDKITNWRLTNIINMLAKAEGKINYDAESKSIKINPRIAYEIVENVSIIEDENLQEMWAGLFAASCLSFEEDENIFFTDILKRLTSAQVKLLNRICLDCQKRIEVPRLYQCRNDGEINTILLEFTLDEILQCMGTQSQLKAEYELDQLENLRLLLFHFVNRQSNATLMQTIRQQGKIRVKPSLAAIRLFIKCRGSNASPLEFFLDNLKLHYEQVLKDIPLYPHNDWLDYLESKSAECENNAVKFYGTPEGNTAEIKADLLEDWLPNTVIKLIQPYILVNRLEYLSENMRVMIDKEFYGLYNYKNGFLSFATPHYNP